MGAVSCTRRRLFDSHSMSEFAGERIPTLNEALDVCEELDLVLFLELKGGSTDNVKCTPHTVKFNLIWHLSVVTLRCINCLACVKE